MPSAAGISAGPTSRPTIHPWVSVSPAGAVVPTGEALIVNLLLMSVFAIQHSVMARKSFKQWWTYYVPRSVERSTYVLFSSLALGLLFWQWRPLSDVVWQIADPNIAMAVSGLSFAGVLIALAST